MSVLKSLCSAFLMYSRLPFPKVEWKEENRRFALCFLPLIGTVIGGLILLWYWICKLLCIGNLLFSIGCVIIPIAVTGGIHLDGFCDVCDALASCTSGEKMLNIMADPNIGAFAAIRLAVYLLIQVGFFSELNDFTLILSCSFCFISSRAWSGFAAVVFHNARGSGSLQGFSKPAHKSITVTAEIMWLFVSYISVIIIDLVSGVAVLLSGISVFVYYYFFSKRKFSGITGDLAGWFLQIYELITIGMIAAANLFFI